MDEGFEVLTAAGICVGKRGDIQRIIKRKNQLTLKKIKEIGLGKLQAHTERWVCVYINTYRWKKKKKRASSATGEASWCPAK